MKNLRKNIQRRAEKCMCDVELTKNSDLKLMLSSSGTSVGQVTRHLVIKGIIYVSPYRLISITINRWNQRCIIQILVVKQKLYMVFIVSFISLNIFTERRKFNRTIDETLKRRGINIWKHIQIQIQYSKEA